MTATHRAGALLILPTAEAVVALCRVLVLSAAGARATGESAAGCSVGALFALRKCYLPVSNKYYAKPTARHVLKMVMIGSNTSS